MTPEQMVEIVSAYKDGKKIERYDGVTWTTSPFPSWDFMSYDYRVKPDTPKYLTEVKDQIEITLTTMNVVDEFISNSLAFDSIEKEDKELLRSFNDLLRKHH